ncbi:protease I [Micromonospora pattaloongensis]|uniref:Protease I n=1 Tax=Micromonospora pattaloongensis TaxID=405436 RepID=A0A1H3P0Z0_9ACTN|nr:type 1 glutamine amidotransferase domain-containing protein [Micromonospora pattaloongensis]SDY94721.1 protease I [Micromonospora pattaloongensis]
MAGQQQQTPLQGKRVAFLAADGVEEVEYTEPRAAAERAGAQVELISIQQGSIQSVNKDINKSKAYPVDRTVSDANPADYDGLVLPGGVVNPDKLRQFPDAMRFVKAFFDQSKPVAAICHGPWSLVETGVVKGRTVTSFPSLRTDITNAGGRWVDEEVHVDSGLVTSRKPTDLPAFCNQMVAAMAKGEQAKVPV